MHDRVDFQAVDTYLRRCGWMASAKVRQLAGLEVAERTPAREPLEDLLDRVRKCNQEAEQ